MKRVIMPLLLLAAMMQLNGAAGRASASLLKAGQTYFQPATRQVIQSGRGFATPAGITPMGTSSIARTSSLLRPTAAPVFFSGDSSIPVSTGGPVCRSFSSSGKPQSWWLDLAALYATGLYLEVDPAIAPQVAIGAAAGYGLGRWTGRTQAIEVQNYWEDKLQENKELTQEKQKNLDSAIKKSINREIDYELKLHSQEFDNTIKPYNVQAIAAKEELERNWNDITAALYAKALAIATLAKREAAASRVYANAAGRSDKAIIESNVLSQINDDLTKEQKAYENALQAYKANKSGSRVQE